MPVLSLVDAAILLTLLASVLGACHRGIAREMLHTVLFLLVVGGGYLIYSGQAKTQTDADITFWLMNALYYLITAYILTWVVMKTFSVLIIGSEMVGLRSRFWAGVLCLTKIVSVVLCLNLWFAMHSPYAHPLRLQTLPKVMQDSRIVEFSDRVTEDLYKDLASRGVVEYRKTVDRLKEQDTGNKPVQTYGQQLLGLPPADAQ